MVKLKVEKMVLHDVIAKRAYEIYKSGNGASDSTANWIRAELELLDLPMTFISGDID